MSGIECQSCDQIDMVQKVTAIVQGETHNTSGHSSTTSVSSISGDEDYFSKVGGYEKQTGRGKLSGNIYGSSNTEINSTQQSALATKLLPPLKPSAIP